MKYLKEEHILFALEGNVSRLWNIMRQTKTKVKRIQVKIEKNTLIY